MAAHYDTAIVLAHPCRVRTRAKSGSAVQVATCFIITKLRNRRFFSLSVLIAANAELVAQINEPRVAPSRDKPPKFVSQRAPPTDISTPKISATPVEGAHGSEVLERKSGCSVLQMFRARVLNCAESQDRDPQSVRACV